MCRHDLTSHLRTIRCLLLALCGLGAPFVVFAQQDPVPSPDIPRYPLPTYDEDWRGLRGTERHDPWDVLKLVSLSADGRRSLSFGGEARLTYERFGNQNFGLSPPSPD